MRPIGSYSSSLRIHFDSDSYLVESRYVTIILAGSALIRLASHKWELKCTSNNKYLDLCYLILDNRRRITFIKVVVP